LGVGAGLDEESGGIESVEIGILENYIVGDTIGMIDCDLGRDGSFV